MAVKQNRLVNFWNNLPKEIRVAIWIAMSGALTALIDYLQLIELNDAILMGIINVLAVLVSNRRQVITSRI